MASRGRPSTEFGFLNEEGFQNAVRKEIDKYMQQKREEEYNTWLFYKELNRLWGESHPAKFPNHGDRVTHPDGRIFEWKQPLLSPGFTWVLVEDE